MKTQYESILESILNDRQQLEEDWGKTLAAGALAAGMALSPMTAGTANAGTAIHQQTENNIVAKVIAGEAANQGYTGMYAVACVIQNRGGSPVKIVTKPHQFSAYDDKDLMSRNYLKVKATVDKLASEIGTLKDITGGATHYVTTDYYQKHKDHGWLSRMKVITTIGHHVFMKE